METSKTLFRIALPSYLAAGVLLVLLVSGGIYWGIDSQYHYVKGTYGNICYIKGDTHKNIRYPIYYKTLSECTATLVK